MTESGKTTLAKKLASNARKRGRSVIVLDPLHDEWDCDFQTNDAAEFLRVFWGNQSCDVFIDESGDAIGRFNKVMQQTATKGRHWGHSVHFLTQRGAQLSPTVRDQCSHLFLFCSGFKDCQIHAQEWNKPDLVQAASFPAGEFFHATRFNPLERGNAFDN